MEEVKITIKEDQDFGFLIAYIPFRTKLLKCDDKFYKDHSVEKDEISTKLILKTVKNNINENVRFYTLYRSRLSLNKEKETVLQKVDPRHPKLKDTVAEVEKIIQRHVDPLNSGDIGIKISDISFSLYNDNQYKQNGFLKVMIQIEYPIGLKAFGEEEKGKIISYVYDVISRNIKNKFEEDTKQFRIVEDTDENPNGIFDYLSRLFDNIAIEWLEGSLLDDGKRRMKIESDDWVFNYDDHDRRCYIFSFYTIDQNIKTYDDSKLDIYLYQIARIHENGKIRTYNDNNDIFSVYRDDTSAVWGVSRVGLGSIIIQEKDDEKFRNINVLSNDFSLIYEFCLHQKFFSYSLIDNEEKSSEKSSGILNWIRKRWERRAENQYLIRKLDLAKYVDLFCPEIISEFETQDIYDLIRKKIEVDRLMDDAKNTLNYLEANKSKQISRRNTVFSMIFSTILFPLTVSEYITRYGSANATFAKAIEGTSSQTIFFICFVIGFVVWLVTYLFTNRYQK